MPGDFWLPSGRVIQPLEELKRLVADLEEAASPPDWAERLAEELRESQANYRLLLAWLDEWLGATSEE